MTPYGTLVVFLTPKGRRYIKRLEQGGQWHSNEGSLSFDEAAQRDFGDVVHTAQGVPVRMEEATLFDRLMGVKRQTQIIYPKDIAYICMKLGVGPGRRIAEAGCGSGALTLGLSWFCGPTGFVTTHDSREEFVKLTLRNLAWAGACDNVEAHHRDVSEGFMTKGADALFLDARAPWEVLEQAAAAARPGATLGFILPTANQVSQLLLALEKGPFSTPDVEEILIRQWKPVADRLRPKDRMTAHTGFLVFCRLSRPCPDFDNFTPKGTRERKQADAKKAREEAGQEERFS